MTFIIAEIAQAHDGSLGTAHAYIDALATVGVDAVKFQTHIAEAESSTYEPLKIDFYKQDSTRFEYWKRMEFTLEQWQGLRAHCDDVGLEFMSSPFSNAAVDLLEKVGVKRYKIGSGEVTNYLLLEKIARTGKPVILSTGMSSFDEMDATISFLAKYKVPISILQCTTAYPTHPKNYGLNVIKELKDRYQVPIGFSDHSARIETLVAATVLGAEILEFHVVFDKRLFGPDVSSSLTINETKELVTSIRNITLALKHPVNKNNNTPFTELKTIFEKSLAINKNLLKGHILIFDDLEAKKPAHKGIPATEFVNVIGKRLQKDKLQWDFLNTEDIA